jgi:hypothetical protein
MLNTAPSRATIAEIGELTQNQDKKSVVLFGRSLIEFTPNIFIEGFEITIRTGVAITSAGTQENSARNSPRVGFMANSR